MRVRFDGANQELDKSDIKGIGIRSGHQLKWDNVLGKLLVIPNLTVSHGIPPSSLALAKMASEYTQYGL